MFSNVFQNHKRPAAAKFPRGKLILLILKILHAGFLVSTVVARAYTPSGPCSQDPNRDMQTSDRKSMWLADFRSVLSKLGCPAQFPSKGFRV